MVEKHVTCLKYTLACIHAAICFLFFFLTTFEIFDVKHPNFNQTFDCYNVLVFSVRNVTFYCPFSFGIALCQKWKKRIKNIDVVFEA